jgi:23S rRNA pseudouridine1911/1915/1917 synthase
VIRFTAPAASRADLAVAAALGGRSRRRVAEAFAAGAVRVNGRRARKGDPVAPGDVVEVLADAGDLRPVAEPDLPLAVVHLDDALIALDKPAGMPTHPLAAGERGTLANALVARHAECAAVSDDPREAGLAHRLDAGTTGLIVAARTRPAWEALRGAFRARAVRKEYLALVAGAVAGPFVVDLPIAHDRARGGARAGEGLPAVTRVEPIAALGERTLVRCVAETGRVHQVRAHLAARGLPIVGDERYGGPPWPLAGFFLHAAALELPHPVTGDHMRLETPLPPDRARLAGVD